MTTLADNVDDQTSVSVIVREVCHRYVETISLNDERSVVSRDYLVEMHPNELNV